MTYDQIALSYLLQGKPVPAPLVREAAASSGLVCPECGCGRTEDNGSTEYRCCACDHRWGWEMGERYGF